MAEITTLSREAPDWSIRRNVDGSAFDRASQNSAETLLCNFCGCPGHFIRQCTDAEEYIQLGKCRRTAEGKIALPTGSFVSRDIPGRFMKLRIDEWHRRNPERLGANGYMLGIAPIATNSHRTMCMSSPSRFRANPTAETSDSSFPVPKRSNSGKGELERPLDRTSIAPIAPIALTRTSPSLSIADHRTTSHTVPTPSADIPPHFPAPHCDKNLQLACPDRTIKSDFKSRIGNHISDIAASTPHHSKISCTTPDHFNSHSAYGPRGTLEPIAPHQNMSPVHSGITPAVDISDSRLTATSRIKEIECELAQLRSHTRVAPHSAYCAPESPDVSDHDADPAIIFRQST